MTSKKDYKMRLKRHFEVLAIYTAMIVVGTVRGSPQEQIIAMAILGAVFFCPLIAIDLRRYLKAPDEEDDHGKE